MTKKALLTTALLMVSFLTHGQEPEQTGPFRAYLYNEEYQVFINLDLYSSSIVVEGQELLGPLPGYLGNQRNSFCWPIVAAKLSNDYTAKLTLINDYGSEDLTATLTLRPDSTYELHQDQGSTIKMPRDRKWQKLPKALVFKKQTR